MILRVVLITLGGASVVALVIWATLRMDDQAAGDARAARREDQIRALIRNWASAPTPGRTQSLTQFGLAGLWTTPLDEIGRHASDG